ncbi:MAG: hypothetical protein COW89_05465, partial [Nitrospinae bacterium CG22_combo_CG10-13_8_21_14_all_47_10]
WKSLLPLNERWKELFPEEIETGLATREDLIRQRIMRDEAFSEELEKFWHKLKGEVEEKGENGKIRYWNFIGAETYEKTVHKAFM